MKFCRVSFAIAILINIVGVAQVHCSSADDRNWKDLNRAYSAKINQAYQKLCQLDPSQEQIQQLKNRNHPILNAALEKYQEVQAILSRH